MINKWKEIKVSYFKYEIIILQMQIRCELNIMHTNSTLACIGVIFPETCLWFCW